jgi:hypothetical protein
VAAIAQVKVEEDTHVLATPGRHGGGTATGAELGAALALVAGRVLEACAWIVTRSVDELVAPAIISVLAAALDSPGPDVGAIHATEMHRLLPNDNAAVPACVVDVVDGNLWTEALTLPLQNDGGANRAQLPESTLPTQPRHLAVDEDVRVE